MTKHIFNFTVIFFLFVFFTGCTKESNGILPKKHFFNTRNTQTIYNISKEDGEKLIRLYDITIPENEKDFYVNSFSKTTLSSDPKEFAYFIEFDNVYDYSNFYECNKHRIVKSTGAKDISHNEFEEDTIQEYYLSYSYFWTEFDPERDIIKYEKLWEELGGNHIITSES